MSQPTPYNRLYNFNDYQTINPTKPLRGSEVDAELDAVKLTTDQLRANIGLIQRDDGKLANQSVTTESLSAGALAMIHQGEYVPRGAWVAARVYALGDLVTFNAATYLCIVAHTSVPQFANDLAANKWLLIANGALVGGGQAVDLFEGTGSQTAFTLTFNYAGNNAAVVFVGGVAQIPTQDFTISGTTITFVVAPPAPSVAGRKNIMVRGTGVEAQLAADLATTQATNAAASATAAQNAAATAAADAAAAVSPQVAAAAASATAAAGSATAAAASYDSFDDRYLGAKTSNPSVDNDGNALLTGAIYFNSVAQTMRVWNGTAWQDLAASPDTLSEREFLATAGQTTYTFVGGYRVGYTFVYVNGVLLGSADITATNGTTITFASALALNDEVRILSFKAIGSVGVADITGLQAALDSKLNSTNPSITGSITEEVFAFSGTVLEPDNGTVQTITLAANTTFTDSLATGQSMILGIDDGSAYTVTWPTVTWTTTPAAAPTLPTSGFLWVVLWKVGSTLYGKY
jgi:hypothetical protein